MFKKCKICGELKNISCFYKDNKSSDGFENLCKTCRNNKSKIWYENNKDNINEIRRKQYNQDKEIRDKKAMYYIENREKILKRNEIPEIKEKRQQNSLKYSREHKEERKIYNKEYRLKNYEKIRKYALEKGYLMTRKYYYEHREEIIQKHKIRYRKDPIYRINRVISTSMSRSIKKEERHWETLVSYTLEELKQHLESQFDENMTWDNYGEYWEIDHIIPINTFKFNNSEDFQICWSLMNLRPLEWRANRQRPKDGSDVPEDLKQKILNQHITKITVF